MQKTLLITGGAGYIGSHTAYLLAQRGYRVIILDSCVHGQRFNRTWATFIKGDFADDLLLRQIFSNYKIDTVIHFAAFIEIGESEKHPQKFYNNNVTKTFKLLDVMLEFNVKNFVFSSSCAVYGVPVKVPIDEGHHLEPFSTYGRNKLSIEFILKDYSSAYNLRYVSLRYFNAAGASPEVNLGEYHVPETHVIPLLIRAARNNKNFYIYGQDYKTQDGTCVRDYIHVCDLAKAHIYSCEYLSQGGESTVFNLGTGRGYSVRELVTKVQEICNLNINVCFYDRRPGDVPVLIADYSKARKLLGWEPTFSLSEIIKSAYEWEKILYQECISSSLAQHF